MTPLLEIQELSAHYPMRDRVLRAVNRVSFTIAPGEIVGLAGESGCGKSTVARCILRALPPPGRVVGGTIRFKGEDLLAKTPEEMRRIRGRHISIVVQEALAALNPVITTGEQVADGYKAHMPVSMKAAWQRAIEMFRRVGIPDAQMMVKRFPHEFSGGMQQRTIIASALMCNPDLIIADEPTTALDVTIQLQVLALLQEAQSELGSGILYISHDLAAVVQICDRVLIMYASEIVESALTRQLFAKPRHPYTKGLLGSIPALGASSSRYLPTIPGMPPDLSVPITGCKFAPRCNAVMDVCRSEQPELRRVTTEHRVHCHLYRSEGPHD